MKKLLKNSHSSKYIPLSTPKKTTSSAVLIKFKKKHLPNLILGTRSYFYEVCNTNTSTTLFMNK